MQQRISAGILLTVLAGCTPSLEDYMRVQMGQAHHPTRQVLPLNAVIQEKPKEVRLEEQLIELAPQIVVQQQEKTKEPLYLQEQTSHVPPQENTRLYYALPTH